MADTEANAIRNPATTRPRASTPVRAAIDYIISHRDSKRRWTLWKIGVFGASVGLFGVAGYMAISADNSGPNKIATVSIQGTVGVAPTAKADGVNRALQNAFSATKVKAVVLRIDSPGGSPSEASRIVTQLELLRKQHPGVRLDAVIEGTGASAAYLIAVSADRVYATPYSLVGSVGAIMQTWTYGDFARSYRVDQHTYKSGVLKDLGNPMRDPTRADQEKAQSLIESVASIFREAVLIRRAAKLKLTPAQLATGEVWTGRDALTLGLIDGFGTVETLASEYDASVKDFSRIPINVPGFGQMNWTGSIFETVADTIADAFVTRLSLLPALSPQ